ncbi:MAG: hypothetical protein LDL41_15355 [Coleofasciculus sp. S288]|nr:hypothetical protein [Coleofasciculus sp. S288]
MSPDEIEAVLQLAFIQCEASLCSLTDQQKQILLQVVTEAVNRASLRSSANGQNGEVANPLDELTPEQRQALLQFVKEQEKENRPWKIQLLNDWLHDRNSGTVQFIREEYGPQWLNRVKQGHLEQYFKAEMSSSDGLKLKVGDRIEVSNGLWEWVQEDGPCSREWFPCTVVEISQHSDSDGSYYNCIIRFGNGAEYEIQGIYQWNRYHWRWFS